MSTALKSRVSELGKQGIQGRVAQVEQENGTPELSDAGAQQQQMATLILEAAESRLEIERLRKKAAEAAESVKSSGKQFSVSRGDDYFHEDKKTGKVRGPYPMLTIQPEGGVRFTLGFGKCRTIATNAVAILGVIKAGNVDD